MSLLLWLLLVAASASGAQLHEDIARGPEVWSFEYRWTDAAGARHQASFELPAELVKADLDVPLRFKKQEAARYVAAEVRTWGEGRGPTVKARATASGGVRVRVTGKQRKNVRRTAKAAVAVRDEALERYLADNGFTHLGRYIVPDHARHVAEYADDLAPVVEALGGPTPDPRDFAELALGFVQSIPYERRARVSDRYRRPLSLLGRNRGDCDSKAVLYLALLRQAYPELELAVVYIPKHAFVALGLDPERGDVTFRRKGSTWVIAEPVGPMEMPVGDGGPKSRRRARSGRVKVKVVG